jgi:hypothetical protein
MADGLASVVTDLGERARAETNGGRVDGEYAFVAVDEVVVVTACHCWCLWWGSYNRAAFFFRDSIPISMWIFVCPGGAREIGILSLKKKRRGYSCFA